jgi:RHS repeat-associated protein
VRTAGKDTLFAAVTDRQNSLTAVMDVATNKIEKFSYKPWGMRRNASNWTTNVTMDVAGRFSRGYCMHEHLPELGLIDMGGRMYNARTNQFLSPDPYVQSPGSWLSHNRFAYCMQNPVWRTDPSGEFSNYYLGLMFDYAEMMANIYLGIQQMLESVAISIQTTVASAQSAATGAASSTAYGYAFSYNPVDYSYNPSVVNNVYAAISQNTQNAVASAKNAVASFGGTMAAVVGNTTNGIGGTANPMIDQGGSVGLTSKSRSFNYYKPQERYKGNGFYGNQYVKTYQLKHLGSVAKKVGGVGTAISTTANLIDGVYKDGSDFFGENTQRAAVKSFGSWAGATAGARLGIMAGSYLPPYGPIIGGFVGGVAGGLGGEWLFENAYNLKP